MKNFNPPRKEVGMRKRHCWKCGKEGNFAGQVCEGCFDRMEEEQQLKMENGAEEF